MISDRTTAGLGATRTEELARYVPSFLLHRYCADPAAPTAPHSETFAAAVLFADISGFTALSGRLAARGPEGVEDLTRILNAYFGQLIQLIEANGGDIVKFAGDALLAIWPVAAPDELPSATLRAAQCGLAILADLVRFAATVEERLSLHVGIGAGEIRAVTIGGTFHRWEVVVMGPAVVEATKTAAHAEPGQIVFGPGAGRFLTATCRTLERSSEVCELIEVVRPLPPQPLSTVALPAEASAALLAFIPAAIHRRLAAGQSAWLTEMRRLTVVFVNLPGLNHATPLADAQRAMTALQSALYRYEGSVNKLSVDEKGITLVAALGLPPLAHEDDEWRGTCAGMEIGARLQQLGWAASIGITSGPVFCGTIGNAARCEYTIIGDVVNRAARLMQAAHGAILADENTSRASRERLRWETLPAILVKGKTQPIAVFRPLGAASIRSAPAAGERLVGRGEERQQLDSRLRRLAVSGAGGVVLIEGEAGIGKSRLVQLLLAAAGELKLAPLVGAAQAVERSTPYFAWRPILRRLLRLEDNTDRAAQRDQVLRELAFAPALLERAPLLDVVLSLDFGDNATTAALFGEARVSYLNELLLALFKRRATAGPVLLILEDCHWLDSASWALARQAVQEIPALLLVVVTRPLTDAAPREFSQLAALANAERLVLTALSTQDSLQLVCARLGVEELPEQVAELLHAKAQGNPFFIEELAYALRDSGRIEIRAGKCVLAAGTDLRTLPFPDTVQGVVTSRIDRLGAAEQLTLKVASIIGRTFPSDLLHDVHPFQEATPVRTRELESLVAHELVRADAPVPDSSYYFKHVITQEVAYQLMAPTQRRTLHQRVAEWYEQRYHGDLSPYYPLLAKHWSNTECVAKSIEYLEKSGMNALRAYANEEAITFFSQAIALSQAAATPEEPFRVACWQRQLAEAQYNLGNGAQSLAHFQLALELLGCPFPRTGWGMVLDCIWEMAKQTVHRLWPSRFLGRARGAAPRLLEAARAYERIVQIRYLNNAKVPTIHAAFRALNLAELVGTCPELARSYANAAVITGLLMQHGTARAHTRRAEETAQQVDQLSCTAYVNLIRGVYWVTVGEWAQAESDLTKALSIAERVGERQRCHECMSTLAAALSRKGDYRQGAIQSRQMAEAGRASSVHQVEVWGLSWELHCLLVLEPDGADHPSLAAGLSACLDAHPAIPLADQILAHGVLAHACWQRGAVADARSHADAVEAIIRRTSQVSHYLLPAYAGLAEVYLGLWSAHRDDTDLVQEMNLRLKALCKLLSQFSLMYPIGKPLAHLVRGRFDHLRGRTARARRSLRASLAAAERYAMPHEQALARRELGL